MTREEALEVIKAYKDEVNIEAFDIAIKALEHPEQNVIAVVPCGDVISRQTVLSMQYRIDDSATLSTRDVVNVDDIEDLPSVNPQEPKILNALDFAIDASNGDTNYFVGFRNGLRYAKSLIDGEEPQFESCTEQEPKWIPVSERLPEENKTVIASAEYGVYPEAKYTEEYGWEWAYEAGADYWRELEEVEAWMPLPKKYESPESEDNKGE